MSHQSPARDSTRRYIAFSLIIIMRATGAMLSTVSVAPVPTVAWHPQRETTMALRMMRRPIVWTNPCVGRSHGRSQGRICAHASTQFHPCALENPTSLSPTATPPPPPPLRRDSAQRPSHARAVSTCYCNFFCTTPTTHLCFCLPACLPAGTTLQTPAVLAWRGGGRAAQVAARSRRRVSTCYCKKYV